MAVMNKKNIDSEEAPSALDVFSLRLPSLLGRDQTACIYKDRPPGSFASAKLLPFKEKL